MRDDSVERGKLEYKCRRCGGISDCVIVPDIIVDTINILHGKEKGFDRFTIHKCPDGGIGVADLIGAVPLNKEGE